MCIFPQDVANITDLDMSNFSVANIDHFKVSSNILFYTLLDTRGLGEVRGLYFGLTKQYKI